MKNLTPLTVLTTLKYPNMHTLYGLEKHLTRLNNPANVDSKKSHLNKVIIGSKSLCKDTQNLLKHKGIKRLRKNGVLAIEVVLSFSQSFIRHSDGSYKDGANDKFKSWVKASKGWLVDEFGENCIHASLHLDETTPHIHAVIIPVAERVNKKGNTVVNLNARGITGGKEKLSGLQDRYANSVKHLGIKRGRKGSRAKKTTLQQYYKALNESKEICDKVGLIPPNSNPQSFNSWQAIVRKVIDSLESQRDSEISKLNQMIKELTETNMRLQHELDFRNHRARPHR